MKQYLWILSAAVMIGALRIKNFANPWLYQLEGATWKVVKISGVIQLGFTQLSLISFSQNFHLKPYFLFHST